MCAVWYTLKGHVGLITALEPHGEHARKQYRMSDTILPGLERRLKRQLLGDVAFDPFTRGRYATDASHYQIMPIGVVAPRSVKEAEHALASRAKKA